MGTGAHPPSHPYSPSRSGGRAGGWSVAANDPCGSPEPRALIYTQDSPQPATARARAEAQTGRGREGAPLVLSALTLMPSRCFSGAEVTLLPRAPATCRTPFFVFPSRLPALRSSPGRSSFPTNPA